MTAPAPPGRVRATRSRSGPRPATPPAPRDDAAPRGTRWRVDDYLSYLLARASHVVASEFHLEVRAAGFTVLEWRVLATLASGETCTVGRLASIALAQQSTVTKLLGRLEAEGRIVRSEGATDRRQSLVRITPEGFAGLAPLLARARRHERTVVERLDRREAALLKSALARLFDGA